jgi:methyltransferase-like protein
MISNNNPTANPNIVFREEDNEALLFNPDTGEVKVLNEVGKFIWSQLDGKNSKEDIVKKILEDFDLASQVTKDVEKFLGDLEKLKFLIT